MADYRPDEARRQGYTGAHRAAIREHALLAVLGIVVTAVAVTAYILLTPDRYEAEADVLVTPISEDDEELKGLGLLNDPTGSVFTAARLLEQPQVQRRVTERLRLNLSRRELLEKVEVIPLPQSDLVSIRVTESSAKRAEVLANTFAGALLEVRTAAFQRQLRSAIARLEARVEAERDRVRAGPPSSATNDAVRLLEARIAAMRVFQGAADPTLRIWSPAAAPDRPKARSTLVIAVAFLGGLLVWAGSVLALEYVNPRLHRRSRLPGGLTALAHVPAVSRKALKDALSGQQALPESVWDSWRIVRSRLASSRADREASTVVLVTSPVRVEGKTVTACSLAVTVAAAATRVILVDANLRRPEVAELFGVEADVGLADVLQGRIAVRDALIQAPNAPGLRLLPAGAASQQAIDLLEGRRIEELLEKLRDEADVVVVDSHALIDAAETVALAAAADVVVASAQLGASRVDKLQEFVDILNPIGIAVLGVVVHGRTRARGPLVPTPAFHAPGLEQAPSRLRSEVA